MIKLCTSENPSWTKLEKAWIVCAKTLHNEFSTKINIYMIWYKNEFYFKLSFQFRSHHEFKHNRTYSQAKDTICFDCRQLSFCCYLPLRRRVEKTTYVATNDSFPRWDIPSRFAQNLHGCHRQLQMITRDNEIGWRSG